MTMVSLPSSASHHLPEHATPFVGRDSEIADIARYLDDVDCRLLTVTGFGGIGKTRLAVEAATKFADGNQPSRQQSFADGTYFVALAPLTSSDLLATTIADKLDITLSGSMTPSDQLLMELEQKEILLLLDNFEHVMAGKQLVSDILTHAPTVTILVTSRERLILPEETVYNLKGMSIPATEAVPQVEAYSALLLFEQIAQKVDWRFALTAEQLPHVIRICRLVEGIPLAIEMAAAWVRVLSCREIAEELTRSYALLKATHGHIPTRHQSIRVVFDYSWRLLTEAEQLVFQKMAVFRGGFRREAAQQITGAALDALLALVDKSLLQHDPHERYHLHELLRQFAKEKLEQNPENVSDTHDQHCAYYADFLHEYEKEFIEYDVASPAVAAIKADLDNVRPMWDWAIAQQQFEVIDRASESLYHYFRMRETWRDATMMIQKAVTGVEAADAFVHQDKLLARLLSMLTILALFGDFTEQAEAAAQQGLSLAQTLSLPIAEARCLDTLGNIAIVRGRYTEARDYLAEGATIFAGLDKTYEAQFLRLRLGYAYHHLGDYDLARECYHQLIFTNRKRNRNELAAWASDHLGHLENSLGHYPAGRQHFAEAVAIFEGFGLLMGIFSASRGLADSYCGLGQYDEARHHFHVALTAYVDHGSQTNSLVMLTLAGVANLLALEGDVARAIELTSFVQQNPYTPDETQTLASTLAAELKVELPPIVLQSAQERGATLELKPLVTGFIEEFGSGYENDTSPAETVSEPELELLQQVTDGLAGGKLFDENLSEKEQAGVRNLVATVDTMLEQEKAKIMATFMESASHDLRTPLTIINTSLYLLERLSDPAEQKGQMQSVKDQVAHMQALIENLVTMARLDGGTELEIQPHDLNQLIIAIQQTHLSPLTTDRYLDIEFNFSDVPLVVSMDSDYLQQALLNIIENAIQYTPDEGTVSIELYSESRDVIVTVRDTGIGIGTEDLPSIFERFYRADKARTDRGRSGLGLTIAQKIVEAHDGYINVVSLPDQGSTFQIVLPSLAQ